MYTRFDNSVEWTTADHRTLKIKDMETTHLMNTVRMLICKPHYVLSMLIADIEKSVESNVSEVWSPSKKNRDDCKNKSIAVVTSMLPEEIMAYVLDSSLGEAMLAELRTRGVNTDNMVNLWISEASQYIVHKKEANQRAGDAE